MVAVGGHGFVNKGKLTIQYVAHRWPSPTIITLLVISALTLLGSWKPLSQALAYYDGWFSAGEFWRPLTAWMAQLNVNHWLINQWGLVLMALVLPPRLGSRDIAALVWVWLACSFALATSGYDNYYGLSGLLYGWLLWSIWRSPFYSAWLRWGVVAILTAKVGYENLSVADRSESSLAADFIQASIAVESHAWGLVAGWMAILAARLWAALRR